MPGELPSGAVTFLFTDVEGSTQLVRRLRDRYDAVLAEHQGLLRTAFAAHGGHEVDTQGDSFFVVFSRAREAVLAAAEGQRSLLAQAWPDGVQVKVRMGVHTGQAIGRGGKYTGLGVHRAARICAAGHGGQILVSQAAQTLLEDEEEDLGLSLRDLGEHRLKDFDRPVRLYQVEEDGLPSRFPSLRTSSHLAPGAEGAVSTSHRRRRIALAAALLAVAAVAAAIALATRDRTSARSTVQPNHVGVIDPETNRVVAEVPAGSAPGPIAAGAGSIWVGNVEDRTITRIGLRGRAHIATILLAARTPTGMAFGAGALWVAHGFRGELSRVEPGANRVTKTIRVADPGSKRGAVAVGDGSVWVIFGDSTLARVDPTKVRVEGATFAGASPSAVVVASNSVWVLNSGDRTVTRFGPRTYEAGAVGRPIPVGRGASAIAAGEGAIWVADRDDNAVTRIDPQTNIPTTIPVGVRPTAIAVGGGLVWVANAGSGTVSRIDPVSNRVAGTVDVGNAPSGIVFAGDFVWVAVQALQPG